MKGVLMIMKKKKTDNLGEMLSILAVGLADPNESTKVEETIVKSTDTNKKKKGKKPIVTLIDSDELDLSDEDELNDYFDAAIHALDDPDGLISDIAGNVDLAIDVADDPMADLEYKNDIIGAGRKYARMVSKGESSEIERAFAGSSAALSKLTREIEIDKKAIDEDIKHMRNLRVRNYNSINGLIENKISLYEKQLQAIKAMNDMTKTQFDLKNKMEANSTDDIDSISTKALQNIFGLGRKTLVESNTSGDSRVIDDSSVNTGVTTVGDMELDDDELDRRYSYADEDTDGELFLEYEKRGVEYVVEFDDEGNYEVFAEDREGNVVKDYPLPSDINTLKFTINKHNSMATDQLQRRYRVKYK